MIPRIPQYSDYVSVARQILRNIGVGVERARGKLLLERESRSNRGPVFRLVVNVVDVVAVRVGSKKLLFAINFLRFEAHLNRALFGGRF